MNVNQKLFRTKSLYHIKCCEWLGYFGYVCLMACVFVGLHWWRWEGHWKSSCVGEPSGSTWVNEWKLRCNATWQILRGNGFCPMRRVKRKHFLKEQPRSLALKKMSSVYSEDTWQLWQHGNSLDWSWQRTPRPVQLEWLPYDWETNGPDARNTEISACKDQGSMLRCWHMLTSKRKEIGWKSKLCTQLLAILRGSRFLKQRNWVGDTVPIFVASPLRFRWITISTRFSDTCARSKNVVTSEDYSDYSLFLRSYNVTLFQSPCACAANALSAGLSPGSKKTFGSLSPDILRFQPEKSRICRWSSCILAPGLGYHWTLNLDLCSFCLKILDLRDLDSLCLQHTRNSTPDLIPWLQGSCFEKTKQDIINAKSQL